MNLNGILSTVKKIHQDELDELMDEYNGYDEELYLYCVIEKYENTYLLDFYYKNQYDEKVTSSLIIEYKDFKQ